MSGASHRNLSFYIFLAVVIAALFWIRSRDAGAPTPPAASSPPQKTHQPAPKAVPKPVAQPVEGEAEPSRLAPVRLVPATVEEDPAAEFGSFEGRVVNFGSSKGLPGAEIVFEHGGGAASVRSGEDGQFQFAPTEPGAYRLAVASAQGFLPYAPEWNKSPIELSARPGQRIRGIIIYLTPAIDYHGTVIDEEGAPVAGAAVRILDTPAAEFELEPIRTKYTSDAKGEFVFHAPDNALLEASHPDHGTGRARLDNRVQMTHRLEIRVAPLEAKDASAQRIAGQIIDTDSLPIPGAEIVAVPQRTAPGPILHPSRRTGTDENGKFVFEGLDAASYLLQATQQGYARGNASALPGDEGVQIVLEPAAIIRGRVVSAADGAPVPAFTVAALRGENELVERVVAHTSVFDPDGRFEITGLEHGEYSLRAMAYGYATSKVVRARATWNPTPAESVTIELPAGGALFGRVLSAESKKPLESARVSVEGQLGRGSSALPLLSTTVTDENGEFELPASPRAEPRSTLPRSTTTSASSAASTSPRAHASAR